MSETQKGVTVRVVQNTGWRDENHPNANKIDMLAEGHLAVASKATGTIAIYAPGKWISAERHDNPQA